VGVETLADVPPVKRGATDHGALDVRGDGESGAFDLGKLGHGEIIGAPRLRVMSEPLSEAYVRKVAKLARLALTDDQVRLYQGQLSAVLGYVERLGELKLEGVDPLANVGETVNRFREDVPGEMLKNEALMAIAPDVMPPFVKVPKVIGDGGGA